jgi:hypothetical protein
MLTTSNGRSHAASRLLFTYYYVGIASYVRLRLLFLLCCAAAVALSYAQILDSP